MRDFTNDVQRPPPYGDIASPEAVRLPIDALHPVWRIAHRDTVRHHPGERIILDHELVLILRGKGRFRLRDQYLSMVPHTVLLIPPFVPHQFLPETETGNDHIAIHFDLAPGLPGPFERVSERRPYHVCVQDGLTFPAQLRLAPNSEMENLFHQVLHARISTLPWAGVEITRHLLGILLGLLQTTHVQETLPSKTHDEVTATRVARVAAYMRSHLAEPLSLTHLQAYSGLGRTRLIAVFRAYTGQTPQSYLRRLRVEHARMLLTDLDLSMKEIAARCGFSDAFAFSKVFRSVQGISPTEYRQTFLRTDIRSRGE